MSHLEQLFESLFERTRAKIDVRARLLRGGLEAESVHLVTATCTGVRGRRCTARFVRKVASGAGAREAEVYARLVSPHVAHLAPRLLHAERRGEDSILFLEAVPRRRWPWRDLDASAAVLEQIATLHMLRPAAGVIPAWDYDADLSQAAASTLRLAKQLADRSETAWLVRGWIPTLERIVEALPDLRRILCATTPFAGAIHGDLHSANVLHKNRNPVFVDWARARHGSALEDVSSWLHSLGTWEPEARRRHDTLFTRYLGARGLAAQLTEEIRDLYWLAGASNALAGALSYHLAVAADRHELRDSCAARCVHGWSRVLRRAHERLG